MQENHLVIRDTKYDPRYAAAHQVTSNFPKTFAERTAERHSYGPGKLNVLYIFANNLAIFLV
jgi:hypothetical protein